MSRGLRRLRRPLLMGLVFAAIGALLSVGLGALGAG